MKGIQETDQLSYIICCGMYRSASTWQYNIVCELCERFLGAERKGFQHWKEFEPNKANDETTLKIIKTHDYHERFGKLLQNNKAKAIYSYRDFRDVFCSLMWKLDYKFDELLNSSVIDITIESYYQWTKQPNILIQSYEGIVHDPKNAIRQIGNFLNLKLEESYIEGLTKKFSYKNNLARANQLQAKLQKEQIDLSKKENFLISDDKTLLHWNHMRPDEKINWRDRFTEKQKSLLLEKTEKILISSKYLSISYSENLEDVILHRVLKDVNSGSYIDVSVEDPIIGSVTKAFYDRGWRGINIQPVKRWYEKFKRERPEDININAAISDKSCTMNLYEIPDTGLITFDIDTVKNYTKEIRAGFIEKTVPALTLDDILKNYRGEIHFLRLDVGTSLYPALAGMNFKTRRPWIILVKNREPNPSKYKNLTWESTIINNGYIFVYFDGLNRFYLAEEKQELAQAFAAPPNVFDDFIRVDQFNLKSNLAEKESQIETLHSALAAKENQIETLNSHIADKENQIKSIRSEIERKTIANNALSAELAEIKRSKSWKLVMFFRRIRYKLAPPESPPARFFRKTKYFFESIIIKIRRRWHYIRYKKVIEESGLFDREWYLSRYQDVAEANIDPLKHYLFHGGFEGRDPSPKFLSLVYLNSNKDVRESSINPLIHYLIFGINEDRKQIGNQTKTNFQTKTINFQDNSSKKFIHFPGNQFKWKYQNKSVAVVAPVSSGKIIGGAEKLYQGLATSLQEMGCDVDLILKEFDESNFKSIKKGYEEFANLNLSNYDLVISTKAPSFMIKHPNHILYLVHTIRVFYDMFEEAFPKPNNKLLEQREWIQQQDTNAINAIERRYSIGYEVSKRLEKWNNCNAEVLYPGINKNEYFDQGIGDYLLMPGRLHPWKRVDLAIQAVKLSSIPIKLIITGSGEAEKQLRDIAGNDSRIEFLSRLSDEKLRELYANALAILFLPVREDYGYVTIEAFHSGKPVITCNDSGEPTKFVIDGKTGLVCEPDPLVISKAIEQLWNNRDLAYQLGKAGRESIQDICWASTAEEFLHKGFPEIPTLERKNQRLKVAILDMQPITPAVGGGRIRLLGLYHSLGKNIDARYVGTYDWPETRFRRHYLGETLEEITIPLSEEHHIAAKEAARKAGGKTVIDLIFGKQAHLSPKYQKETLEAVTWADVVIFSHPWVYPLVDNEILDKKIVIYDSQNVEFKLRSDLLDIDNPYEVEILNYVNNIEQSLGDRADLILTCSKNDLDEFENLYNWPITKLSIYPNGVFTDKIRPASQNEKQLLRSKYGINRRKKVAFFIGSNYKPNIEAAEFIIKELAPKVKDVIFIIAGGLGDHLKCAKTKNLIVTGFIESAEKDELLRLSDFAINPMMSGSGTNLKMFEFMAAGLPIISTKIGARGICNSSNEGIKLEEIDNFSNKIKELIVSQKRLIRAGEFNRQYVEENFSWEEISPQLGTEIERLWRLKTGMEVLNINEEKIPKRIAHLSSMGIKCGIGDYTTKIITELNKLGLRNLVLSCETPTEKSRIRSSLADSSYAWFYDNESWTNSRIEPDAVNLISDYGASHIIIQYHPAFFSSDQLEEFVIGCVKMKIDPIIITHNFTEECIKSFRLFNDLHIPIFSHRRSEISEAHKYDIYLSHLPLGVDSFKSVKRDISNREWDEKPPRIITNGFLRKHKGIRQLIDAMPEVINEFPGAKLIIQTSIYPSSDSAEEYAICLEKIKALNLERNISLNKNFLTKDSLLKTLNSADIAVFPYEKSEEGGSASASDAVAVGLPIIVSTSSVFDEMRPIALTTEPDKESIANTIIDLLKSPRKFQICAKRSREYAKINSWSNIVDIVLASMIKIDYESAVHSAAQMPKRKLEPRKALSLDAALPHKILIGTHHKTGTAWMMNVFQRVATFYSLSYYQGKKDLLPEDYDIFLEEHSCFELEELEDDFRGLHLIRDPRDVIISGCFYHQHSEETWLHIPRKDLQGMTYQEKINSYNNLNDKILFEMEHAAHGTIKEMSAWNYKHPKFFEAKYEDLIVDEVLDLFHRIFTFLGFPGQAIPGLLEIAYHNSLFSGSIQKTSHVRSGKREQWPTYFTPEHKFRFLELFGDVLIDLGYEIDHRWVEAD